MNNYTITLSNNQEALRISNLLPIFWILQSIIYILTIRSKVDSLFDHKNVFGTTFSGCNIQIYNIDDNNTTY